MAWFRLPYMLLRVRVERPESAAEVARYLRLRGRKYSRSRPLKIVLAALERQAARSFDGQLARRRSSSPS